MRLVDASEPWNALPNTDPADVVIATNRDELVGLANCIGEALNAIDDWEFDTRVGLLLLPATLDDHVGVMGGDDGFRVVVSPAGR